MEGYRYLVSFQLADVIYQLTYLFTSRHVNAYAEKRTREQMEQAARSGKQNIAEGYEQKISLKGYIHLLGVARGSHEELKLDYEDYLKRNKLPYLSKDHRDIKEFREYRVKVIGKNGEEILYNVPKLPNDPMLAANMLITLISMETYLLQKQMEALIKKHEREGGFTEKLYKARIDYRDKQRKY